jgi:hypothetical protein
VEISDVDSVFEMSINDRSKDIVLDVPFFLLNIKIVKDQLCEKIKAKYSCSLLSSSKLVASFSGLFAILANELFKQFVGNAAISRIVQKVLFVEVIALGAIHVAVSLFILIFYFSTG